MVNGEVYHSSLYTRQKSSASHLVMFNDGDHQDFGKVEYFVKSGNAGYAVINIYRNLQFNVCERGLPESNDPVVKEIFSSGYLGRHFTAAQETILYKLIKCSDIVSRIVLITTDEAGIFGYVSTVLKSYQHN